MESGHSTMEKLLIGVRSHTKKKSSFGLLLLLVQFNLEKKTGTKKFRRRNFLGSQNPCQGGGRGAPLKCILGTSSAGVIEHELMS